MRRNSGSPRQLCRVAEVRTGRVRLMWQRPNGGRLGSPSEASLTLTALYPIADSVVPFPQSMAGG